MTRTSATLQWSGRGADDGSASIWVLAIALAALALAWAVAVLGLAVTARHRAETAADFAALAAASAEQSGADACSAGARVAMANGARLTGCVVAGDRSVTVEVAAPLPVAVSRWAAGSATATARAGS